MPANGADTLAHGTRVERIRDSHETPDHLTRSGRNFYFS